MNYYITAIRDRKLGNIFHYVYPAESRQGAAADVWRLYTSENFQVLGTELYHGGVWPNVTPSNI